MSWRGNLSKLQSSYWGASGLSACTTFLLHLHIITRNLNLETWLFPSLLCWRHTTLPLIPGCLTNISCWMKDHHLQLNLVKTELLVAPAIPTLHYNFFIQLGLSFITSSRSARNLRVVIDDQLSFTGHIARTAHCYLPYTTLGGSAPSYRSMLHNSLSKLLFYPDWTIIILSWQVFQLALSTLCNWSRMLQLEWSWTSQKEAKNLFLCSLPWLFPAGGMTYLTQPELLSP